jgi:hypothetical protein
VVAPAVLASQEFEYQKQFPPIAKDVMLAGRRRDRLSNPDAEEENPKARNVAPYD